MSKSFSHWRNFSDSDDIKEKYKVRMRVISLIRDFFVHEGFFEVETPLLVEQPGLEPNLVLFESELIDRTGDKRKRYLITSPEHQMKMLLCSGFENIFQICKCFRNSEEGGRLHNPEFTMLEWYRNDADYRDVMKDAEKLIRFIVKSLFGGTVFTYQGESIDVGKKWELLSVRESFHGHADIENILIANIDLLKSHAIKIGVHITDDDSWDDVFFKIFLSCVEPKLGRGIPTILYDYPAHMAALSKKRGNICERFEVYISGMELANAFSELTDANEQKKRFSEERNERKKRGVGQLPFPENFSQALESGMPRCSGIALGVDRLIMLLTNSSDIREILPFAEFYD